MLHNMRPENYRVYLSEHDSGDFSLRDLTETIMCLGQDPEDFRNDEEMYEYIKKRFGAE